MWVNIIILKRPDFLLILDLLANLLQGPPVTKKDLLFNDIYFNPFVIQVVNS
jgi:hypothetical protein